MELYSHRGSKNRKVTATLGSKGWHLHVLYKEGDWARVQRNGLQWVRWEHLEESDRVWPEADLPVTDSHTTASHHAWVKLMADVGYTDRRLTTAIQKWLRGLGYYKGRIDGVFGPMTVRALQTFLVDKGFLPNQAYIDGVRKRVTINAEIRYLNDQRQYY